MPHNRTRIWVGLAIVAVTIPAVAQYYYGSASHPSASVSTEVATGTPEVSSSATARLAMGQTDRDYLAEVDSALAKSGSHVPPEDAVASAVPLLYQGPLSALEGQVRPVTSPATVEGDKAATSPAPSATRVTSFDPQDYSAPDVPNDAPQMSDRTVYQLVLDNLSGTDRDTFVRAWAVMTPEERASLLDEWRTNLENRG